MLFIIDNLEGLPSRDKKLIFKLSFDMVNSFRIKIRAISQDFFLNLPVVPIKFAQKTPGKITI